MTLERSGIDTPASVPSAAPSRRAGFSDKVLMALALAGGVHGQDSMATAPTAPTGEDHAAPAAEVPGESPRMREARQALEALRDGITDQEYESAKLTLEEIAAAELRHEAGIQEVRDYTRNQLEGLVATLGGNDQLLAKKLRKSLNAPGTAAAPAGAPQVVVVQQQPAGVQHLVNHEGQKDRPQSLLFRVVAGARTAASGREVEFNGLRPGIKEREYALDNGHPVAEGQEGAQRVTTDKNNEYDLHTAYRDGVVTVWCTGRERQNAFVSRGVQTSAESFVWSQKFAKVRAPDGAVITVSFASTGWSDKDAAPAKPAIDMGR